MCTPYMPDITKALAMAPDVNVVCNKEEHVFVAGDVIKGHIEVIVYEPTSIKGEIPQANTQLNIVRPVLKHNII